jgi:hypothetical protein
MTAKTAMLAVLAGASLVFGSGCRREATPSAPPAKAATPATETAAPTEPLTQMEAARAETVSATGVQFKPNGIVVLHLASCTNRTPPFAVVEDEKAAQGRALAIPALSGKDPGSFDMSFELPQGGKYAVWLRAFWEDGCGNSVRMGLNEQTPVRVTDNTYGAWHWVQARFSRTSPAVSLEPGVHRLRLWNREDGIRMDQVLLAPWDDDEFMRYIPQGIE